MTDDDTRREVREQLLSAKRRDLIQWEETADLPGLSEQERESVEKNIETTTAQIKDLEEKLASAS